MAEDWDFYVTPVDDLPASIFVDLGVVETAPDAILTRLLRVTVPVLAPRDDGLSDESETESLYAVEDALFAAIGKGLGARYVGRMTRGAQREFFFYSKSAEGFEEAVRLLSPRFPKYQFAARDQEDRDWGVYFDLLYPGELDLQSIHNRRLVDQFIEQGDDLNQPREVDHFAYFPSPHAREKFLLDIGSEGFRVEMLEAEEPDAEFRYGARLTRMDPIHLDWIDGLTIDLLLRASTHGGEYDGWGAAPAGADD